MKLRGRLLLASTLLVLAPLALLAFLIRQQTADRLRDQYERRVVALADGIEADFEGRDRALRSRLRALKRSMPDDNRLRRALAGDAEDGSWLLDYAGQAMALLGLDALQIQGADGRILSSGHFRNDYDRFDPETPARLALSPEAAVLTESRRPEGPFLGLSRVDSLRLGDVHLTVVGATEIGPGTLDALAPDDDLTVLLHRPGGFLMPAGGAPTGLGDPSVLLTAIEKGASPENPSALHTVPGFLVREIRFPASGTGEDESLGTARLFVLHSLAPIRAVLRGLDGQLALAWLLVAAGTLAVAARISARISRPLEDLAERTATLDLDRLDAGFPTDRGDEVGVLSRFLDEMTRRLRAGVGRLREAERRATLGDLARQVNHDLRNGITPLRNVLRHLADVADESPADLARVWNERRTTLDSGLGYLEDLAGNWSKLSTHPERLSCDVSDIVRQVTAGRLVIDDGPVELTLPDDPPCVAADPVGLRRVVENLVANACDCLESAKARVRVSLAATESTIVLRVDDDGPGIAPENLDRVFDHFWTTKPSGSGLGLSIVRRLVSDFEGTIDLESESGRGTTVTVSLPRAGHGEPT